MDIKGEKLISVSDTDLVNGVFLNNEIEELADGCFNKMKQLVKVVLPKLKICGNECFRFCDNLKYLELPLLESCGNECFFKNAKLTSIELPSLVSCNNDCFRSNDTLTSIELPALANCADTCFYENKKLTSLAFPELESCGESCFSMYSNLKSLELPLLASCGDYCFYTNDKLTILELPALTNCGETCFSWNAKLTSVKLPVLESCGDSCFNSNDNLINVALPLLASCGGSCFLSSDNQKEIQLPQLASCGDECFSENINLTSIELPLLVSCGDECFSKNTKQKKIELPILESCGYSCFSENDNLISIKLTMLTTCGERCFQSNDDLKTVELPMLSSCGKDCLYSNFKLTNLELHNQTFSVKNIDKLCFVIESKKTIDGIIIYSGYIFSSMNKKIKKEVSFVTEKDNFLFHGKTIDESMSKLNLKLGAKKYKSVLDIMTIFKDRAFKNHITLSLYGKKIIDKELNKLCKSIDFEEEGYSISPTIWDFLFQFELNNEILSSFKEMKEWMVDDKIFKKIVPYFDGEEHPFEYSSYQDVLLLPNLTSFESTNMEVVIDVSPLIEHKKIKRVVLHGTKYDKTKVKNGKEKEFKKLLNAGFKKNSETERGDIEFVRK